MKRMLIFILILILIPAIYVGTFLIYGTVTRFQPAPVEDVTVVPAAAPASAIINMDGSLTFMTWNIGYGGLGAETDFFYDSGKMVISPEAWVKKYAAGINMTVGDNKDADFIFIQEADRHGKRSWNIDEVAGITAKVPDHNYAFAVNYDVKYLPFPWTEPLGTIYGGLLSLTKYTPTESKRISLPGITDWPRKLFYLERCLLMQRFKLPNGKELIVINTHFEAYDDGSVKKEQMKLTKKILEEEYAKGNYVVLGGDWNIAPPDFNVKKWEKEINHDKLYEMNNDSNYIKGWKYVYDGNTPTNRKNSHAFDPNSTFTTVIDYFFVSPNIDVVEVKGINAGFDFSDHNPVRMTIKFAPEHPVVVGAPDTLDSLQASIDSGSITDSIEKKEAPVKKKVEKKELKKADKDADQEEDTEQKSDKKSEKKKVVKKKKKAEESN